MKIKKILNKVSSAWQKIDLFCRYGSQGKPELELIEEHVCCKRTEGRGSRVTELPKGISIEEQADLDYFQNQVKKSLLSSYTGETKRQEEEDAIELQKTIIAWQKLAGIQPEKTLDLLIPIKEGKTERRRSVNFKSTSDMVAYLKEAGFVPYDLDYIEEARTGKYRFIRIKRQEVKNFFEFPDAKFNGPEFYQPYTSNDARPIVYGPYLAPHQLSAPVRMTAEIVQAKEGKISTLAPLREHASEWKNEDGVFIPKTEIDYLKEIVEKPAKDWLDEITGYASKESKKKK